MTEKVGVVLVTGSREWIEMREFSIPVEPIYRYSQPEAKP